MLAAAGLVLVQPRNADNLAAIAHAMRAFTVVDWVVVSTEQHVVGMRHVLDVARAFAAARNCGSSTCDV